MRPTSRGFALPVAVLGLVVVGVLVTGGFYVARQEARIGMASESATQAFYVAEMGIADVLLAWDPETYGSTPSWEPRVVSGASEAGEWTVRVTRMSDHLYFLDSRGDAPARPRRSDGTVTASRRVGTVARVQSTEIDPPAAVTARSDVTVAGGARIDGGDVVPQGWSDACAEALVDLPPVRTGPGGPIPAEDVPGAPESDPATGGQPVPWENPMEGVSDLSWSELAARADLRLPGGTLGSAGPVVDADGRCDRSAALNWGDPGDPGAPCGTWFPIVHVSGSARMGDGFGQGILMVDGDLTLTGDFRWYGLLVVRGALVTEGVGNRITGAAVADVARLSDDRVVGQPVVRHSTCALRRSILMNGSLTRIRPLDRRGWVDLSAVLP